MCVCVRLKDNANAIIRDICPGKICRMSYARVLHPCLAYVISDITIVSAYVNYIKIIAQIQNLSSC